MDKEIEAGRIKDIPVVDFGMNVLALSVFPFLLSGFIREIANKSKK